jgi:hypothetical protein
MVNERGDGRSGAPVVGGFDGLMSQLGFPAPQALMAELQRLNGNLEAVRPDIHVLAEFAGSGQLREFAGTMKEAGAAAARIEERLWPQTEAPTRTRRAGGVAG